MKLSALSRMTSSSNSFQPSTLSSTSTSCVGDCASAQLDLGLELARVLHDGAARAAQREAGRRISGIPGDLHELARLLDAPDVARTADTRGPHARHRVLEELAILGLANGVDLCADQLHADGATARRAREARAPGSARSVPPSVGRSASGRSRSMMADSVSSVERLDVGAPHELRVGHDGRRVRVDQHHVVAELDQAPWRPACPSNRTRTPAR